VPNFRAAMTIASQSQLLALVPAAYLERMDGSAALRAFELPVEVPPITVSQMWHPRLDRDPAHRWLRALVLEVCGPDALST